MVLIAYTLQRSERRAFSLDGLGPSLRPSFSPALAQAQPNDARRRDSNFKAAQSALAGSTFLSPPRQRPPAPPSSTSAEPSSSKRR